MSTHFYVWLIFLVKTEQKSFRQKRSCFEDCTKALISQCDKHPLMSAVCDISFSEISQSVGSIFAVIHKIEFPGMKMSLALRHSECRDVATGTGYPAAQHSRPDVSRHTPVNFPLQSDWITVTLPSLTISPVDLWTCSHLSPPLVFSFPITSMRLLHLGATMLSQLVAQTQPLRLASGVAASSFLLNQRVSWKGRACDRHGCVCLQGDLSRNQSALRTLAIHYVWWVNCRL